MHKPPKASLVVKATQLFILLSALFLFFFVFFFFTKFVKLTKPHHLLKKKIRNCIISLKINK